MNHAIYAESRALSKKNAALLMREPYIYQIVLYLSMRKALHLPPIQLKVKLSYYFNYYNSSNSEREIISLMELFSSKKRVTRTDPEQKKEIQ